ncbi:hypothetical protein MAE02_23430 [Microvirga aerophila]|uniref:Uncharacterized protein n=1 Tax=Microvirga aerophila TaxID=670291 RepID=A0A512BS59_9HYPH|nr:hypothetical protein MAE02_23430 [Microvirga aerophila]
MGRQTGTALVTQGLPQHKPTTGYEAGLGFVLPKIGAPPTGFVLPKSSFRVTRSRGVPVERIQSLEGGAPPG